MTEFDIIQELLAPLATSAGACGLADDVAELETQPGKRVIVTTDALVEGVHFLADDPLDDVAAKLVAVNVSDIIAKGGTPHSASLALIWPENRPVEDIRPFAAGLGSSLSERSIQLLGGDTTRTQGPLTLVMTLNGLCEKRGPVRRAGARIGDKLWVTGAIGDAGLGLKAARRELVISGQESLLAAYRTPMPPPALFSEVIAEYATASIDVSDGLLADAGHIASVSGVALEIRALDIPLSSVARSWAEPGGVSSIAWLAAAGDDYQTLFTAAPESDSIIRMASDRLACPITCIGQVMAGEGVSLEDGSGKSVDIARAGWKHF